MNSQATCNQTKVLAMILYGMIALSAIGCDNKLDRIGKGADDVDQHSQRILEEANSKK
jgi:hypothetical protein